MDPVNYYNPHLVAIQPSKIHLQLKLPGEGALRHAPGVL